MSLPSHFSWQSWRRLTAQVLLLCILMVGCFAWGTPPAYAGLTDDRFDGNIFPLYAGDGSMIPPRVTLAESLQSDKASLLVLYIDDSRDCKEYVTTISRLSAFYGRAADFIPISVDRLPVKSSYEPTEAGYYYQGVVPQTVLFDPAGKVALNAKGILTYEQIDDAFREAFDLLPRSESVELKRRPVNEISTELAE